MTSTLAFHIYAIVLAYTAGNFAWSAKSVKSWNQLIACVLMGLAFALGTYE